MSDLFSKNSALRIIDAALNRALEGARVVEDYARMHLNSQHLAGELKNLRHDVAKFVSNWSQDALIARNVLEDVGTKIETASEYKRANFESILRANFGRLLQSLRTIEEYGKLVDSNLSRSIEQIRYRTYALEKALITVNKSKNQLSDGSLYVLIDGGHSFTYFKELVQQIVEAGADVIQLRDKQLDDRSMLQRGRLLTEVTGESETIWIMNDRPDLASLCMSDGVHLGQTDISISDARRIVGSELLVGVSTHSIEQAKDAELAGADYIGAGPVFPSDTKHFEEFADRDFLNFVANQIGVPSFAIGGVNLENIAEVLDIGFVNIAVGGCVTQAENPASMVHQLKDRISRLDKSDYDPAMQ